MIFFDATANRADVLGRKKIEDTICLKKNPLVSNKKVAEFLPGIDLAK